MPGTPGPGGATDVHKLREPAAFVLLGSVLLQFLAGLVHLFFTGGGKKVTAGDVTVSTGVSFSTRAYTELSGSQFLSDALLVGLVVLAVLLATRIGGGPSPQARLIAMAGLGLLAAIALFTLIAWLGAFGVDGMATKIVVLFYGIAKLVLIGIGGYFVYGVFQSLAPAKPPAQQQPPQGYYGYPAPGGQPYPQPGYDPQQYPPGAYDQGQQAGPGQQPQQAVYDQYAQPAPQQAVYDQQAYPQQAYDQQAYPHQGYDQQAYEQQQQAYGGYPQQPPYGAGGYQQQPPPPAEGGFQGQQADDDEDAGMWTRAYGQSGGTEQFPAVQDPPHGQPPAQNPPYGQPPA